MWDLTTITHRNEQSYCEWIASRLCRELEKSSIALNGDTRKDVLAFVRTIPKNMQYPLVDQ